MCPNLTRIRAWQQANPERVRAARRRYKERQRARKQLRAQRKTRQAQRVDAVTRGLHDTIIRNHYLHSVPSGSTWTFTYDSAIVLFSIPGNPHLARWLLGSSEHRILELSRLWAPDGHRPNLLTEAIAYAVGELRKRDRDVAALIAYADPNHAHHGGVYQAGSWRYLGATDETRAYVDAAGRQRSRRAVLGGKKRANRQELQAEGLQEVRVQGKHRYARGLTRQARKAIAERSHGSRSRARNQQKSAKCTAYSGFSN